MNALFDALIRGSIRNRHLVLVGAVALVGVELWLVRGAQVDALPSFTPPMVTVQAEAPGMGSTDVERLVTAPLEQALLGTPGATLVRSTSSPGLSVIELTFVDDTDVFRARQLVSERMLQARERLPDGMPEPLLAPISAPVGALLKFCLTPGDPRPDSLRVLWQFAEWRLRPRLEAIQGVSRVSVHGGASTRVEIRPDPAAMISRGVGLEELERTLTESQGFVRMGFVDAGAERRPLRLATYWSIDDLDTIASTVIARRDGLPVRVGDLAVVKLGEEPAVGAALYDGAPALYLQIDKLPWADTLTVTRAVESALAELDAELPPGARRQPPSFRQADFVHTSLWAVGRAMTIGAALLVVILIAFLRSGRLAAISLAALPLSLLTAVAVLLARDVPINGMILGGFAVAIGEVVDDAIVDLENIWRRLRENAAAEHPQPAMEVVRTASAEVRGAVVYASCIVVAVLTPVMIMGGIAGRIFSPLAQAYALAVAASLLVALTVTPALCAVLLPRLAGAHSGDGWLTAPLRHAYARVLRRASQHPGSIVAVSCLLGVGAVIILPMLGGGFLPEFHENVLIAEVSARPGTSLEETTRMAAQISRELDGPNAAVHVAARVGRASLDEDAAPVHRIELDLVLPAGADPEEVVGELSERLSRMPGVRFGIEGFLGERINELLSGERAPIAVKLSGPDLDALRAEARSLVTALSNVEGVNGVHSGALVDVPATDIEVDAAGLGVAGLRRMDVARTVASFRQGFNVGQARTRYGTSVAVAIAGAPALHSLGRLPDLPLLTGDGAPLPLGAVARVVPGSEPASIRHEYGQRVVSIAVRAEPGDLTAVAGRVEALLAKRRVPAGVHWQLAGQAVERREAGVRLAVTVAIVLVAVFGFLWMAFRSPIDAAVVLVGIPLGLVGGVAAALLLPEGLSMAGLVGFVTLFGIIGRNGIMLVTHKNHLTAQFPDTPPADIVLRAAQERLIPILMTAGAAFFGLLPLAVALGSAGSELESPMAVIVCGGIMTSTVLNLIAVPAFYLWTDARRRKRPVG